MKPGPPPGRRCIHCHKLLSSRTLCGLKVPLAHLNEFPDYYTRLERMEQESRRDEQSAERDKPRAAAVIRTAAGLARASGVRATR
jgi:hypothetical protein